MKLAVNVCEILLYKFSYDDFQCEVVIGLIEEGDIIIELSKKAGEILCLTKFGVGYVSGMPKLFEYFDEKI